MNLPKPLPVDKHTIMQFIDSLGDLIVESSLHHRIFCEGDFQSIVFQGLLDFLRDKDRDANATIIANMLYFSVNRKARKGIYPDIVVIYHSDTIFVVELKESINGPVSKTELEKDFANNLGFNKKNISTSVLLLSQKQDLNFIELSKNHYHKLAYNRNIVLQDLLDDRGIDFGLWKREHENKLARIKMNIDNLTSTSQPG